VFHGEEAFEEAVGEVFDALGIVLSRRERERLAFLAHELAGRLKKQREYRGRVQRSAVKQHVTKWCIQKAMHV
jgi:hypothetical protein